MPRQAIEFVRLKLLIFLINEQLVIVLIRNLLHILLGITMSKVVELPLSTLLRQKIAFLRQDLRRK